MRDHDLDEVLFVWNADGTLVSRALDAVHKIVRPETYQCDLCVITHGALTERREWRDFVNRLGLPARALHRDEFAVAFPGRDFAWPAVLARRGDGLEAIAGPRELAEMDGVADLAAAVTAWLSRNRSG